MAVRDTNIRPAGVRGPICRLLLDPWTPAGLALVCILKSRTVVGLIPPLPAQIAIPTTAMRKSIGRSLPEPWCWDEGRMISTLHHSIRWWHSYSSAKGSARCPGFVGPKWLRFEQRCSPETRDGWIGECRWLFCFFVVSGADFWCNLQVFDATGLSEARTIRLLKMCGFCLPWYPKPPKDHNLPTSKRCEPWPATRLLPFGPWGGEEGRPDRKIDLHRY